MTGRASGRKKSTTLSWGCSPGMKKGRKNWRTGRARIAGCRPGQRSSPCKPENKRVPANVLTWKGVIRESRERIPQRTFCPKKKSRGEDYKARRAGSREIGKVTASSWTRREGIKGKDSEGVKRNSCEKGKVYWDREGKGGRDSRSVEAGKKRNLHLRRTGPPRKRDLQKTSHQKPVDIVGGEPTQAFKKATILFEKGVQWNLEVQMESTYNDAMGKKKSWWGEQWLRR